MEPSQEMEGVAVRQNVPFSSERLRLKIQERVQTSGPSQGKDGDTTWTLGFEGLQAPLPRNNGAPPDHACPRVGRCKP